MKNLIFLTMLIVLFCFYSESFAFRCGTALVTSGDTKTQVQLMCGKPTSRESACEGRQSTMILDKDGKTKKYKKCSKKVEVWHYNCGENDYIYALTFENGKLTNETTEGRGRGKSDCNGK
jgi:hypothetical protein